MKRAPSFIAIAAVAWLASSLVSAQPSVFTFGSAWDDLRGPATRLFTGASNPPTWITHRTDGAGSVGTLVLSFDDETVAGNENQVWYDYQFTHGYEEESTAYPHHHWNLEDTTVCNVRWCWEYERTDDDTGWPANTSIQCADCPSGGTTDEVLCNIWGSGLSMTGFGISTLMKTRIFRNSSHANDTCDGKAAYLHDADIHFKKIRPGSRGVTTP